MRTLLRWLRGLGRWLEALSTKHCERHGHRRVYSGGCACGWECTTCGEGDYILFAECTPVKDGTPVPKPNKNGQIEAARDMPNRYAI